MNVNLGCGPIFSNKEGWVNYDFDPIDSNVKGTDLLSRLPLSDNSVDCVYSSHFFEHVPFSMCLGFLTEVERVLKPGGVLRIVLPDFYEQCREYIEQYDKSNQVKLNFSRLAIIDQLVRQSRGGQLGAYYSSLSAKRENSVDEISYVYERTGHVIGDYKNEPLLGKVSRLLFKRRNFREWVALINKALYEIRINIALFLLPRSFRNQNVSRAAVGERHQWGWDFYQLKELLSNVGFKHVQRMSHVKSHIPNFPFNDLDSLLDGSPRKGLESMYVEAIKK
jgi:SAM-dependent methyltransferase